MSVLLSMLLSMAFAAPHKTDFPQQVSSQQVRSLVQEENLLALKEMGPHGYKTLRALAFSEQESMSLRWKTVIALARIGGEQSLPDLKRALQHPTWFMRGAGLLAHSVVSEDRGVEKAKQFVSKDPSLLVRATALQIVAQGPQLDREFLWKELYNPINFDRGHSLSLRTSLLKLLQKSPLTTEKQKFAVLKNEKHPEIQKIAQLALHHPSFRDTHEEKTVH